MFGQKHILRLIEKQGLAAIRHIQPVSPGPPGDLVAEVYARLRADFGMLVAPMALHAPVPELLACIYTIARELFFAGRISRPYKEAISTVVSQLNDCPFCVDLHAMALHSMAEHQTEAAIVGQQLDQIEDDALRGLLQWAAASRSPGAEILRQRPIAPDDAAELIGLVVAFHYINRMVHIFLAPSPLPLLFRPSGIRGFMRRMLGGSLMQGLMDRTRPAGESLDLLPAASLPEDMGWAESNRSVAQAFARQAAGVERAGEGVLPAAVRQVVLRRLETWQGEDAPLSRAWIEEETAALPDGEKAAGRLALLAAFAAYRVDDGIVADFRAQQPEDEALIGATSWASFQAARRIGTWL